MKRSDITTLQVLAAYKLCVLGRKSSSGPLSVEKIIARNHQDASEKVIWRAMEREFNRGFIDYGVNLRWGWLTEKGEAEYKRLSNGTPK